MNRKQPHGNRRQELHKLAEDLLNAVKSHFDNEDVDFYMVIRDRKIKYNVVGSIGHPLRLIRLLQESFRKLLDVLKESDQTDS